MGPPGNICTICGAKYGVAILFCPQDGAPLGTAAPKANDPLIGVEIRSGIRIEKLIGVGTMGRVYLGVQSATSRRLAVKVLHPDLATDDTIVARFHREAAVTALLRHPNVVEVVETGELARPSANVETGELARPSANVLAQDGGAGASSVPALFMVMEYVGGISLRSAFAAASSPFSLPRALDIVLQLADAVGHAHASGVVHRDLKPENVMLVRGEGRDPFVKVLDFGMARFSAARTPGLTRAGLVFGTARYISPEGARGQTVGPAGDVYAMATILFQALAGRTPFEGDSAVQVLAAQIDDPPPPLSAFLPGAPVAIERVIADNLAKIPEDRCPDGNAFARALRHAARAAGVLDDRDGPLTVSHPTRQLGFGAPSSSAPLPEVSLEPGTRPVVTMPTAPASTGAHDAAAHVVVAKPFAPADPWGPGATQISPPPTPFGPGATQISPPAAPFGPGATQVAEPASALTTPAHLAPNETPRASDPLLGARQRGMMRTLVFIVLCLVGGAALAALGASLSGHH